MSSWGQQLRMQHLMQGGQKSLKIIPLLRVHGRSKAAEIAPEKVKLGPLSPLTLLCGTALQGRALNKENYLLSAALLQQTTDLHF